MTEHFNDLSPAQAERLAMLAEECGEVVQAVCKILRHGYRSHHPEDRHGTNRHDLERELGDLLAILHFMAKAKDIHPGKVDRHSMLKRDKVEPYVHHQPFPGMGKNI